MGHRKRIGEELELITIRIYESELRKIDEIARRKFTSRSEAIRYAIKKLLEKYSTSRQVSQSNPQLTS